MNFRELFTRLDELDQSMPDKMSMPDLVMANKMSKMQGTSPTGSEVDQNPTSISPNAQDKIPGKQPDYDKPNQLSPEQLKALQFPNQKPDAEPAKYSDPKKDIELMKAALGAVAGQRTQPSQPTIQPNTSASVQQQKDVEQGPRKIDTPKPGEPLEEARRKEWWEIIRDRKDTVKSYKDVATGDSADARRMRAYIAHVKKNPGDIWKVSDENLRQQIVDNLDANTWKLAKAADPKRGASADSSAQERPPASDTNSADAKKKKDEEEAARKKREEDAEAERKRKEAAAAEEKKRREAEGGKDGKDGKGGKNDAGGASTGTSTGTSVGAQLALASNGAFKNRTDRLNQEKVDSILGKGKYTAGTAAANLALLAHFRQNPSGGGDGKVDGKVDGTATVTTGGGGNGAAQAAVVPSATGGTNTFYDEKDVAKIVPGEGKGRTVHFKDGTTMTFDKDGKYVVPEMPKTDFSLVPRTPEQRAADDAKQEQERKDQEVLAAEKKRLDDLAAAQGRQRDKDLMARYGSSDPSSLRVSTGNMKKSHFDLKQGDRDVDPKTGNVMRWRAAPAGQHPVHGSWEIDDTVAGQGFKERPGLGWIGPASDSAEGKAIYDRQRSQIISADDLARLQALRGQPADQSSRNTGNGLRTKSSTPGNIDLTTISANDLQKMIAQDQKDGKDITPALQHAAGSVKEDLTLKEMSLQLNSLKDELIEWSMSDRLHPDFDYDYKDLAIDAGITGLGALATYATGGLAAPIAGTAAVARGGRLANMLHKTYQGGKNVAQGVKAVATSPEARALANQANSKADLLKGGGKALAGDIAFSAGVDKAGDGVQWAADKLGDVNKRDAAAMATNVARAVKEDPSSELERIKHLSRR